MISNEEGCGNPNCDEQERREAAARTRIAAVTKFTEERLMRNHILRQNLQRSLRCADACCVGCGECKDHAVEASPFELPAETFSADDDEVSDGSEFDDDEEDMAWMARMRASRLEQLQATVETSARGAAIRGVHARLREGEDLATILADPKDTSPVILHLAPGDDDSDACRCVEDALRRGARDFPNVRVLSKVCSGSQPPECLYFLRELPALLVVENGVISSLCMALPETREPEAIRALVIGWLAAERERLVAAALAGSEDEDDSADDSPSSYCGRPGCKTYFHEHVGIKKTSQDPRVTG